MVTGAKSFAASSWSSFAFSSLFDDGTVEQFGVRRAPCAEYCRVKSARQLNVLIEQNRIAVRIGDYEARRASGVLIRF